MSDLAHLDATDTAALIASGEASAAEVVDAAIERVEAVNDQVNAVISPIYEMARDRVAQGSPAGPFGGVPIVLKDYDGPLAGAPYHCGMAALRDAGYVADWTDTNIARLLDAGFVPIGKTNTPELGLVPTTEPDAYGPSRNPWDTGRSTGGSSGGTAAAVASRMVAVGSAGDGGGSIRIPASECGLFGLKPTRDRVPVGPKAGEDWAGLVVRGVITRTVRDSAAIYDLIGQPDRGQPRQAPPWPTTLVEAMASDPKGLRIGIVTDAPGGTAVTQDEVATAVRDTGALLESLGHHVTDASPAALDDPDLVGNFFPAFGTWTLHAANSKAAMLGRPLTADDVEPGTWTLIEMGRATTAAQYMASLDWLHGWARRVMEWWADFDLLLTPTIPEVPMPLGEFAAQPDNALAASMRAAAVVPFQVPFNVTGQPAASLPLHWSDSGLPIGSQIVADFGREDVLVAVAAQVEQARPWADRVPPVSAG